MALIRAVRLVVIYGHTQSGGLVLFTVMREPPPNRRGKHEGSHEEHFPEAAVMLAFAMHLFESGSLLVEMHPDGEHAKRYDIRGWLTGAGFSFEGGALSGCVGRYTRGPQVITVDMRAGKGDVVGSARNVRVVAECKGGIINTRHSGQLSILRKRTCEAVGQLLGKPLADSERHVAVVPYTATTATLAARMAGRCRGAGVEIVLVKRDGALADASSIPHG